MVRTLEKSYDKKYNLMKDLKSNISELEQTKLTLLEENH